VNSTARRLAAMVIATIVTALLVVTGVAPLAQAATDSSLTIRVTTVSGAALTGATVRVIAANGGTVSSANEAPAKSGTYVVSGELDSAADYAIQVTTAPTSTSNGFTQFYGGSATLDAAATISPTVGANVLSFSLQSGSLGGRVLTTSSKALKNVDVALYRFAGSRWNHIETVTSSGTGAYAFPHLEPGSYTVAYDATRLQKTYASVYAGGSPMIASTDAPAPDTALTSYYVTAGKATTANQKVPTGGSIAGIVRGGSTALAGVGVRAMLLAGNPTDGFTGATIATAAAATSTSTGAFTVTGLSAGYYALSFDPTPAQDATFSDPYSDPTLGATAVKWIKVTAGKKTTTATTTLTSGAANAIVQGTLSGSPSTAAGTVRFYTLDDRLAGSATITGSGTFSIGLTAGRYRYRALPSNSAQPGAYLATYGTVDAHAGQTTAITGIPFEAESPMAFSDGPTVDVQSNSSGDVFTVTAETNHPTTSKFSYQWLRAGIPIFGARDATFQTGGADVGHQLSVRVSAVELEGGVSITGTTDAGTLVSVGAAPELLQQPSVTPSANVTIGTVLRVVPGPTAPSATNFAYQWYEDGLPVAQATKATYTVRANVDAVQVEVTPVLAGREAGLSDFSPSVAVSLKAAPVVKAAPKLTSKALSGGVTRYSVAAGSWTPTATSTFVWRADGAAIASGATYNFDPSGEFGHSAITVDVQAQLTGYATGLRTLVARKGTATPTQTVATVISDSTTGADINDETDAVTVGDVLTLTTGVWTPVSPNDVPVISYRWERKIGSTWTLAGTGTTYTVLPVDVTRSMRLVTTATTKAYPVVTVTQPAGLGTAATGLEIGAPTAVVGGSAIVGETLTLSRDGSWSVPGVTDTYSWLSCTASCQNAPTNYTVIAGATKATLVVPASLSGASVVGRITGSKPGFVPASVDSEVATVSTVTTIVALDAPQIQGLNGDGDAAVGHPLTAATGTYNLPGVTKRFAWEYCSNGCGIPNNWWRPDGYTTTFTPGYISWQTGLGDLRLVEIVSKAGYATQTFTSVIVDVVEGRAFEAYPPTFTKAGSTVTVAGSWEPLTGIQYQWLLDGVEVGTDQPSFTVPAADIAKVLELRVTIADPPSPYAAEGFERTYVAANGTLPALTLAPIAGTPTVGSTLTAPLPAVDDLYDISPTYSYRWYSGTTAISGATSATFVPTSAHRGKAVSVRVTVAASSYASKTYTSAARTIGYGTDPGGSVDVTTAGSFTPGAVLTAHALGYDPAEYTFSYVWQANGVSIAKATKRTYTLTAADAAKSVRAVVTIARAGYSTVVRASEGSLVSTSGPLVATTLPTFAGVVNGVVTARTTLTIAAPAFAVTAAPSYAWYRDGVVIRGAKSSTFVTSPSDAGTSISATVTAKAAGYDPTTFTIPPVQVVEGASASATKKPAITGKIAECSTLTASAGVWNVDGLTFAYQWMTGSTPIAGATAPTFVVPNNLYTGTKLSVVVTATRSGIANGTSSSAATSILGSSGC
jgi:hypothetical protein